MTKKILKGVITSAKNNKTVVVEVTRKFAHPFYDMETISSQKNLSKLQGINNSWFCGSYFGYGFHEDGLKSAIDVANKL